MGLIGGGLKKSVEKIFPSYNFIHVFFLMLFVIILKMLLVKYSYNEVVPRLMKDENTYKLTYTDSLLLVILFGSLL
jgi:hypothetical protein